MNFNAVKKNLQREGLVPLSCREQSPYYYSRNGGTARERAPGSVFLAVKKKAIEAGIEVELAWPASWSGKWPRTKQSIIAEQQGDEIFWGLVEKLHLGFPMPTDDEIAEYYSRR